MTNQVTRASNVARVLVGLKTLEGGAGDIMRA